MIFLVTQTYIFLHRLLMKDYIVMIILRKYEGLTIKSWFNINFPSTFSIYKIYLNVYYV